MGSIYFGDSHPIKKKAVQLLTKSLRVTMPSMAMKLSRKMLLKPRRRQDPWPKQVEQLDCLTRHGNLKLYKYGEGKTIWLVHGWSGAGVQFWPIMEKFAEQGFSTITFDLPAHGFSEGEFSSLPKMIQAFDDISAKIDLPCKVITHSMGASVIANSQWLKTYNNDITLIAPLLETFNLLQATINRTGFDQVLFDRIIQEVLDKDNMHVPNLNAAPHFINFDGNLKIIHDLTDKFAPIEDSKKLAEKSGAELHITDNLGHGKILRSDSVVKII